jgi:hypothetical protein
MNILSLRHRARKLWGNPQLQRKWLRAVVLLGDKWILHPSCPPVKWGHRWAVDAQAYNDK